MSPAEETLDDGEHIFHLALAADWAEAQRSGAYTVSTLGRTLDEEGFIHASRRHQVEPVRSMFYDDPDLDLVLLEIDPSRLTSPLRLELPPDADQGFPHIYGPLDVDAVVAVTPVER
jgi:uncharacterized protein (DUF952 family)